MVLYRGQQLLWQILKHHRVFLLFSVISYLDASTAGNDDIFPVRHLQFGRILGVNV